MPEQIFLDSEVRDFAHLASCYRQYPLPRTAICRPVRRAKLIVTASHVSERHHESERNGGFRLHPYAVARCASMAPETRAAYGSHRGACDCDGRMFGNLGSAGSK
jgi:hypothetical protein